MQRNNFYLTVLLVFGYSTNLLGQITLTTQAEVDAWDQNITDVVENLTISGPDITNIDALSVLKKVSDTLIIEYNDELISIDGFAGLTEVTGLINIERNKKLTNIDGFSGLTQLKGTLDISWNSSLSNINGFSSLKDIKDDGYIILSSNDDLTNIDGFSSLENVSGTISIYESDGLLNIDGFSNLQDFTGRIILTRNDLLSNIDGFSELKSLSGKISIDGNNSLTHIDAFDDLTDIEGILEIENNTGILNLDGLSGLTDISGHVLIRNIDQLTNINIFSNLNDVSGRLYIFYLENLMDIDGLSNITSLTGQIRISFNEALQNIEGLSHLTEIIGEVTISGNSALTNINALSNLSEIKGTLDIDNNDGLTDLQALSGFSNITGELIIEGNDGLSSLDEFATLDSLTGTIRIIENNGLTNIDGFLNLNDIKGLLRIQNNNGLTELNGLSGLTDVTGNLTIMSNSGLTDIHSLENISMLTGQIWIHDNPELIEISGLSGLSVIDGSIQITKNESLKNLDGLFNIKSISGGLNINNNPLLENINGLSGLSELTSTASIEIENNASLKSIDGLSGLSNSGGNIYIQENQALINIDGLAGLTEISNTSDIRIIGNNALENINGLSNVTSVKRRLTISNNHSLTNINGLSGIKEVTSLGRIFIENNDALNNLDGFFTLEDVSGKITIADNDLLSSCCGLTEAIKSADLEDFDIHTNLNGCNSPAEILDTCSLIINYDQNNPCEGLENGRINLFASDFHALPFIYQWEESNTGLTGDGGSDRDIFSINNLAAGIYQVTISLPNGARNVIHDILLDPIAGYIFEFNKITTTSSTNNTLSGGIHIVYSGGSAPYEVSWSGTANGSRQDIEEEFYTISGLGPGDYTVQITEANGQSRLANLTLLDEEIPIFPCSEPLDIVVLSDVSGSVDDLEYEDSKRFFIDFLNKANIGPGQDESQATIIEWAGNYEQSVRIPLTSNIQEINSYHDFTRAFEGGTSPHPAFLFGADYIETIGRENVEKAFILATDGTPSTSLIILADELKAKGYHIITIAFDNAYARSSIRDILTQVASIPFLAPGAPSYSDLNTTIAENIVSQYLCPLDPGSASSVYFHRDGAIVIDSVSGPCPVEEMIEITFTVSAMRDLSIAAGTSVMFYHNDPILFGSTPIHDFSIPCAIAAGSSETFSLILPIKTATKLYAVLNDDGSINPPIQFPITDIKEYAYANNMDSINVCVGNKPTLQALKYTTTSIPICESIAMYTIDVCNIGLIDADSITIMDLSPIGSVLLETIINTNQCSEDQGQFYSIPSDCCITISLAYDVSNVSQGYYGSQNVILSGPPDYVYIDYDGSQSGAEDVMIGGEEENCPSTNIWFVKEVSEDEICEDGFLEYTYTIHNETSSVIYGATFTDILPSPMEWVYKPYATSGISISSQNLSGTLANFVIDEIHAETVASFKIDAYTGDWLSEGSASGTATLESVIDLENGGLQTLVSNDVSTQVYDSPCDSISLNSTNIESLPFVVFPNPTSSTIRIKNLSQNIEYRLFDSTGRLYERGFYNRGEIELQYEGVNFIQLLFNAKMKTFKVTKIGNSR